MGKKNEKNSDRKRTASAFVRGNSAARDIYGAGEQYVFAGGPAEAELAMTETDGKNAISIPEAV